MYIGYAYIDEYGFEEIYRFPVDMTRSCTLKGSKQQPRSAARESRLITRLRASARARN